MTKIEYSAYIAADFPEENVDPTGFARLRDKARNMGLTLVGEVTRVQDDPVVGVKTVQADNTEGVTYVPVGSPAAGGQTAPDARLVRWEIEAIPVIATDPVKVDAVVIGEGALSRAQMPDAVTENGGLVELKHGLGGEVTVSAYGLNGQPVGYSYGVDLDDNRQEILLPPGVARLEVIRDEEEPATDEGGE